MTAVAAAIRKYKVSRLVASSSQRVTIGNFHAFERTQSWSTSIWVRRTATSAASLIDKRLASGTFAGWFNGIATGGALITRIGFGVAGGNCEKVSNVTAVNNGKWHHIVMTYNGTSNPSGIVQYIDTVDAGTFSTVNTLASSIVTTGVLCLGCRDNTDSFLDGDIQDAAIFSGVLSSADVVKLYNRGVPPDVRDLTLTTGGPLGYWLCGEHKGDTSLASGATSGTTVPDLGSAPHNGTLNGGVTTVTRASA